MNDANIYINHCLPNKSIRLVIFFYKIFIFVCVAKPLELEPVVKKLRNCDQKNTGNLRYQKAWIAEGLSILGSINSLGRLDRVDHFTRKVFPDAVHQQPASGSPSRNMIEEKGRSRQVAQHPCR